MAKDEKDLLDFVITFLEGYEKRMSQVVDTLDEVKKRLDELRDAVNR